MAGNWKLNPESLDDAKALAKEVVEASSDMPVRQAARGRGESPFKAAPPSRRRPLTPQTSR